MLIVSSENKRDQRTIEEVLAENKARKKQKTENLPESQLSNEDISNSEVISSSNEKNTEIS